MDQSLVRLVKLENLVSTIGANFAIKQQVVDFVEANVKNIQERIDQLDSSDYDERITDIENMNIEKRLLKLEEMQKNMLSFPNIIWSKYNKTPHRCPVCDGHGNPDITDSTERGPRLHMIENDPCNSCKGKGIIWD